MASDSVPQIVYQDKKRGQTCCKCKGKISLLTIFMECPRCDHPYCGQCDVDTVEDHRDISSTYPQSLDFSLEVASVEVYDPPTSSCKSRHGSWLLQLSFGSTLTRSTANSVIPTYVHPVGHSQWNAALEEIELEIQREERQDWIKLPDSTEPRTYEDAETSESRSVLESGGTDDKGGLDDDEQEAVVVPPKRGRARTRYGTGRKKNRDEATPRKRPMEDPGELEATPNKWQGKSGGNGKFNWITSTRGVESR